MPNIITRGSISAKAYGLTGVTDTSRVINGFINNSTTANGLSFYKPAYDSSGNVYVGGYTTDASSNIRSTITKFEVSTGTRLWTYSLDSSFNGTYVGNVSIYNDVLYMMYSGITGSSYKGFVRMDTAGTIIDAKQINSPYVAYGANNNDIFLLDSSGNIFLICWGYEPTYTNEVAIVVKLNSSLVVQWAKGIGFTPSSPGYCNFRDIRPIMGPDGNISFTAYDYMGYTAPSEPYMFTVSGSTGNVVTANKMSGAGAYAVPRSTDALGNAYSIIGGYTLNGGFLIKTNSSGTILWQKKISTGTDDNSSIVVDAAGNSYVYFPYVLYKFDTSGTLLWAKNITAPYPRPWMEYYAAGNQVIAQAPNGRTATSSLPSKTGPANGTYTTGSIAISTATPTITNSTLSLSTFTPAVFDTTASVVNASASRYSYTAPTLSSATVAPA